MIFGVGQPRTGNHSLAAALKRLGFKPLQWIGGRRGLACRYLARGDKAFLRWFGATGHDAWIDWPVRAYRDLARMWPEARWILTLRSPETWVASFQRHLKRMRRRTGRGAAAAAMGREKLYGAAWPTDEQALAGYKWTNIEVVRFLVSGGYRVLTMDLEMGDNWEALCRFLEIDDVPDEPFPHLARSRV